MIDITILENGDVDVIVFQEIIAINFDYDVDIEEIKKSGDLFGIYFGKYGYC